MTGTYRYVEYSRILSFEAAGWIFERVLNPYRVLMRACACNQAGREP